METAKIERGACLVTTGQEGQRGLGASSIIMRSLTEQIGSLSPYQRGEGEVQDGMDVLAWVMGLGGSPTRSKTRKYHEQSGCSVQKWRSAAIARPPPYFEAIFNMAAPRPSWRTPNKNKHRLQQDGKHVSTNTHKHAKGENTDTKRRHIDHAVTKPCRLPPHPHQNPEVTQAPRGTLNTGTGTHPRPHPRTTW